MDTDRNKESNFISAVAYLTTGYESVVEDFLEIITTVLEKTFTSFEIIFVNDNCRDGTVEIIRRFSQQYDRAEISIITMSYFHGKEKAMRAGVDLAIGDFIFEFENVLVDYPKELISAVYSKALEGYDVVCAAQNTKPRIASRVFYYVYNHFSDGEYKVESEIFRVVSRRMVNRVQSSSAVIPYRNAAYANSGLKKYAIKYDPKYQNKIKEKEQRRKKSKVSIATTSLIVYTDFAEKCMYFVNLASIAAVFVYMVLAFFLPDGFFNWGIFILMLIGVGLAGALTLTIHYLDILVKLAINKKDYMFDSVEKLTR